MGIGREVADAYIDVHGDITKFRKELEKAKLVGKKAGAEAADSFNKGFEKRGFKEVDDKWEATLDALYTKKSVDWDRVFKKFDSKNFGDAKRKIMDFAGDMQAAGKLTYAQFDELGHSIDAAVDGIEEGERATADLKREQERLGFQTALNHRAQEKYNESFEGMFRANRLKNITTDFQRVAKAMEESDWNKFTKGFADLDVARDRVRLVVNEMQDLGKITDTNADKVRKSVDEFVAGETKRAKAMDNTSSQLLEAIEMNKKYDRSLTGIMRNTNLKGIEKDFKRIGEAMATTNWGPLSKDFGSMTEFRKRIDDVTRAMRKTGEVSDAEYDRIHRAVNDVSINQRKFNVELDKTSRKFRPIQFATDRLKKSWSRMDSTVRLVIASILAAAGPVATLGSGLAGALTAVVSSVGSALGSIVPLVAVAGGFALAISLAVSSFDQIKKDLPGIEKATASIGKAWETQAAEFGKLWGPAIQGFLQQFDKQMKGFNFGKPFGSAMAMITASFEGVMVSSGFQALKQAMVTDLPLAVQGFGEGLAGVTNALVNLFAGAAPAAKLLGESFSQWGGALGVAMEEARKSGAMAEVFEKSRESLSAVFDLLGSVGNMLGALFMVGADSGNRMLTTLANLTDQFTAFLHTDEGRAKVTEWFTNAERIMAALKPVLVAVATGIASLVDDHSISQFENLMTSTGDFTDSLIGILDVISDLGILNVFAEGLASIGDGIQPLLGPLGELAKALGPTLQGVVKALGPIFATIGTAIAPIVEKFAELQAKIGPPLVEAIGRIGTALKPLIEGFGAVAKVVADFLLPIIGDLLIGVINDVVGVFEGFSQFIVGMVDTVKAIFSGDWAAAWESLKSAAEGALNGVWSLIKLILLGKIGGILKGFLGPVLRIFSKGWSKLGNGIKAGVAPIVNFFSKTLPGLFKLGKKIIDNFPKTFKVAFEAAKVAVIGAVTAIGLAIVTGIGAAVSWLIDNLGNIGQFFADVWTGIADGVSTAWAFIKDTLANLWTGIVDAAKAVWEGFSEFFVGIWDSITEIFTSSGDTLSAGASGVWDSLVGIFNSGVEAVITVLSTFWSNISGVFSAGWAFITDAVSTNWAILTGLFSAPMEVIGIAVSAFWETITTIFSAAWTAIQTGATAGWEAFMGLFGGFFESIGVIVQAGWDIITTIFTTVWEAIQLVVAAAFLIIVNLFTGNMGNIAVVALAFWDKIKALFFDALLAIGTTVLNAWTALKQIFLDTFTKVKQIVDEAWMKIVTTFATALVKVRTTVTDAWNKIVAFTAETWTKIMDKIKQTWLDILANVTKFINQAKVVIQNEWNSIKNKTQQVWDSIVQSLRDAWNRMIMWIATSIVKIRNKISDGWENIKRKTRETFENMVTYARDSLIRMRNAVNDKILEIITFFAALPGKIEAKLSNLKSRLTTIGTDMIQGMINGVRDMALNLINAVGDVIGGAVDWAKKKLGINSPSKVFRAFGEGTGEGFIMGMDKMQKPVQDATNKLMDGATGPFSANKWFIAGKDAASGLAKGLTSNKSKIDGALSGMSYSLGSVDTDRIKRKSTSTGRPGDNNGSGGLTIAEGAINLTSNASDSEVLAEKLMDAFSAHTRG